MAEADRYPKLPNLPQTAWKRALPVIALNIQSTSKVLLRGLGIPKPLEYEAFGLADVLGSTTPTGLGMTRQVQPKELLKGA